MIAWLAHFLGWSYSDLMEMPLDEIFFWYEEAAKLNHKLTPKPPTK